MSLSREEYKEVFGHYPETDTEEEVARANKKYSDMLQQMADRIDEEMVVRLEE